MDKIYSNLYSRQIFTYGVDTMDKIINLKILIIGLRGLGIEIAKNLILAGPNEVSILDKNICKINDMCSNFYISKNDINIKTREESCYNKLKSLNPYVKVTKHKGIYKEDIKKFNVIIITEIMRIDELYELNNICRRNKINFIYTLNLGLTGFLFNDFGDEHYIYDINGEKKLAYNIFKIEEKEDNYEIFLEIEDNEVFQLKEGEYVIFKEVKGFEFLNDGKPREILVSKDFSFEIKNENNNKINNENKYINNGIIEEYKMPKKIKFNPFKDNFINFNNNYINIDASKIKSNVLLHCAFVGLHFYYCMNNKLPELNDLKQVEEVIDLCYKYYLVIKEKNANYLKIKRKNKIIEFEKEYIIKILRWCKSEINPLCAFLGGIVSQEALKITGKYMPIYQWLRFEFFETISNIPENVNRKLLNSRYDDQIAIFGQEMQKKLQNLNIFMIGAGALGCEYIKNFGLMGISCNDGKITITDNDNIVLSNLNRQFLFNQNDVKENNSKSYCAKREALKINNNMKIKDYQLLVNDNSTDIFDDEFFEKQNIIISAVDNLKARRYLDNLCTFYNKIFIDSGTEGTKANSDIYYPNKSICLNDSFFEAKKEIPMCTLKNFPTQIEHCIEFSKIVFSELFNQYIKDIKLAIEDRNQFYNIINQINDINQLCLNLEIYEYMFYIINNSSQYLIIKYIFFIFKYYFEYNINKLLDEKSNDFSNNIYIKKPSPLKLDLSDKNTILYFKSFFYIISDIISFKEELNIQEIKSIVNKEKFKIKDNKSSKEELITNFKNEILDKIDNNMNNIAAKIKLIKPVELEKDNDENFHINFILSFSNLRANCYNIENCDFLKVKEIAGNIIPAIASTTAAITGLSCLQIYNIIQADSLNEFRNSAFNLATSNFNLFQPQEKIYIKNSPQTENSSEKIVIPKEYTVWDKIDIYGPNKTIKEIVEEFKNKYDADIDYINCKNKIIASPIDGEEDFNKTVEELYESVIGKKLNDKIKYIKLEISGIKGDADISTPTIRYILKK